ncbi:MAG TPA: hypothetical protein VD971_06940 [Phycisphaerales bacterium]|nr:hypothetical protein [Phycisphaerales bacterium]
MRVGPLGDRWLVDCEKLGSDDYSRLHPTPNVPTLRIGDDVGHSPCWYTFTVLDAAALSPCCRLLVVLDGWHYREPMLLAVARRVLVVTPQWLAQVDPANRRLVWEHTPGWPAVYAAWLLDNGETLYVGELGAARLDASGKALWQHNAGEVIVEFRRENGSLHLKDFAGASTSVDETTGGASS